MKPFFAALALGLIASAPGFAQDKKGPDPAAHPGVDPKRVKRAIDRGIEFLKTSDSPGHNQSADADELILLTFLHAGAEAQPRFKTMFDKMMTDPLKDTYSVALQAMVLEELDRVRYQGRIHQCAQFLVDNQCKNGQWSYGTPTTYPDAIPVPKTDVPTGLVRKSPTIARGARNFDAPDPKQKPRVQQFLSVKKNRDGPASGDNSNSQYAALGIRACHESGIVFPREVIDLSRKYWIEDQEKGENKDAVATGPGGGIPRGWGYGKAEEGKCYGSMTAGAIGALCIFDFILAIEFKKDKGVQDGIAWLAKNFIPTNNPGRPGWFHYYYLYGVERAGMLADVSTFGAHDWYLEGANLLLDQQRADGAWGSDETYHKPAWSTCFAILFLKQATRRLDVASTDRR